MKFVIKHSRESDTYGQVYVAVLNERGEIIFASPMRDRIEDMLLFIDTVRRGACHAAVEEHFLSGTIATHRVATGQALVTPYDHTAEGD